MITVFTKDLEANDTCINYAVSQIQKLSKDVVVESSYYMQMLTTRNNKDELSHHVKTYFKNHTHLNKIRKLIVPVNLGNVHWICIVVCIHEHVICVYDSDVDVGMMVKRDTIELSELMQSYLVLYGSIHNEPHFTNVPWKIAYIAFADRQDDGWSCGYHVIQCMIVNARIPNKVLESVVLADTSKIVPDKSGHINVSELMRQIEHITNREILTKFASESRYRDVRHYKTGKLFTGHKMMWIRDHFRAECSVVVTNDSEDSFDIIKEKPVRFDHIYRFQPNSIKKNPQIVSRFESALNTVVRSLKYPCSIAMDFSNSHYFAVESMLIDIVANIIENSGLKKGNSSKIFLITDKICADDEQNRWLSECNYVKNIESLYRDVLYHSVKATDPDRLKLYVYKTTKDLINDWKEGAANFDVYITDKEDISLRKELTFVDVTLMKFNEDMNRMDVFIFNTETCNDDADPHLPMSVSQLEDYPQRTGEEESVCMMSYFPSYGEMVTAYVQ